MPMYDGVVIVAEADIPVVVELGDDVVRLSASGREIGEWRKGEYEIRHLGDSTFAIQAENEVLEFVPSQPSRFAAALNGGTPRTEPETTVGPEFTPVPATSPRPEPREHSTSGTEEAPPPKPLTMVLFYALCLVTAGLAIWSILSLIF